MAYHITKNHSMNLAEFLMKKERISLLMDISNQKSIFKRSVVLDLYRITDELRKKIWNICGNILEKGETVSIHVRRGDYLKLPHALPFCGKSYYKNAIQYIGEDKIFIICSDDIDWCKKTL